jgi:hypothetical protein
MIENWKWHESKNIDAILGYKAIRTKVNFIFIPIKLDKNVKHKRCPAWLFIRDLERKINLDIENCCDSFNRMFGYLYKNVYYYTPLTIIKDYKNKKRCRIIELRKNRQTAANTARDVAKQSFT